MKKAYTIIFITFIILLFCVDSVFAQTYQYQYSYPYTYRSTPSYGFSVPYGSVPLYSGVNPEQLIEQLMEQFFNNNSFGNSMPNGSYSFSYSQPNGNQYNRYGNVPNSGSGSSSWNDLYGKAQPGGENVQPAPSYQDAPDMYY